MNTGGAVVIGVGNEFRRDDGVGPALIDQLLDCELPGVRAVASDGEPTHLLEAWSKTDLAIVVDAVRCDPATPGRIHRVRSNDPLLAASTSASSHGLGIAHAVHLAEALGRSPGRLVIYAVEGGEVGFGSGLSPDVARALPYLLRAVLTELGVSG